MLITLRDKRAGLAGVGSKMDRVITPQGEG